MKKSLTMANALRVVGPALPVLRAYSTTSTLTSKLLTNPKTVSIVGMPMAFGQPLPGVEKGPTVIRAAGLAKRLSEDGWTIDDLGDLPVSQIQTPQNAAHHPNAKHSHVIGTACKMLAETVAEHAKQGKFVLTLGGDHSIAMGSIAGLQQARPDTAVIWVDAHADINTPDTSLSGNVHGMALAFLMGLHNTRQVPGFEWMRSLPKFLHERLVYVGLRDLDPAERVFIKQIGIKAYTMHDLDKLGVGKVMEMALDHVCNRVERPLHFSVDIDSVDPFFAPSTGTRVRGGLAYREAYYIAEAVSETGLLASMDMVEVNPLLGQEHPSDNLTVDMAVGLISSAMGNKIL